MKILFSTVNRVSSTHVHRKCLSVTFYQSIPQVATTTDFTHTTAVSQDGDETAGFFGHFDAAPVFHVFFQNKVYTLDTNYGCDKCVISLLIFMIFHEIRIRFIIIEYSEEHMKRCLSVY